MALKKIQPETILVYVGLDRVGLLLPREPRRGHGVFGGIVRRAAMGDDFNGREW